MIKINPLSGKWLWYGHPGYNVVNAWMQARKTFHLKVLPRKSIIHITADTAYRLYINGCHVNRGPARGFQDSWPYDTLNITPFLKPGKNVIAVIIHHMGIGTFQYIQAGFAGFLCWGKIGELDISSNSSWKIRPAPGYQRVTTRVSLQLGFQEFFDANLDDESWMNISYDDSDWRTPQTRNFGSMPWYSLEERGIPLLREKILLPDKIVSESSGNSNKGFKDTSDVVTFHCGENENWNLSNTLLSPSDYWTSFNVTPDEKMKYSAYVIDFGKEVVGSIRLKIEGAVGHEIIDTLFTEAIDSENQPIIHLPEEEGCRMAFGNRLILRPGMTEHEQFDHWGFRYLVLIVRNCDNPLKISLRLQWVGYPLEIKSEFQSDNLTLNKIYQISSWTQQSCMLDSYVDCPWREQAQWWGDARIQGLNTFYLSADTRLFKRGMIQIGTQEVPNGLTYGHAPTIAHEAILPDFSLLWIVNHWDYYWQTGDLSLFIQMKERIHRLLSYFTGFKDSTGLLKYDDRYWLFLDWTPLFKEGYPTVYNLIYLLALQSVVKLFQLTGDRKSVLYYKKQTDVLIHSIQNRLFNKKDQQIYGGLDYKKKSVIQDSGHLYSLAILANLFPEYHETFIKKYLLPIVNKPEAYSPINESYSAKQPSPFPSSYFIFYIYEALKKYNYDQEIMDSIERWWGKMIDKGLTTTEEIWNAVPGIHSLCHAWSAHPIIHISNILLGIKQAGPGWKKVIISPRFMNAKKVLGKVATPLGIIESGWISDTSTIEFYLKIPKEIKAEVKLPNVPGKTIQKKIMYY